MSGLKLLAMDEEDLNVVSAHMQDSVFKISEIEFDRRAGQLSLAANRFVWESAAEKGRPFERRKAALVFKRVSGVKSVGVDRNNRDAVLDLLAIRFDVTGEGPEGAIELVLAGGAAIRLDVECIEVQLADIGGAWEAKSKPQHSVDA
jgi:hypothetical protein